MSVPKPFRRLFRITRFRFDSERDIRDEIEFYLEMRAREFIAEGIEPGQARRRAREVFGNLTQIEADCRTVTEPAVRREQRRLAMDGITGDLKFGLRMFRKSPLVSVIAVLTLALGIGATATILSLVNGVLLAPLPYQDSDRMVYLWERLRNFPDASVSYPNYLDWRERNTVFEEMACYNYGGLNLSGEGHPVELRMARITASSFDLIGIEPFMGRAFTPEDDQIGAERVTILSLGCWNERFGGDPEILGRVLTLDDQPYTIVGVVGQDFLFPPGSSQVDIYVPIALFAENWITNRGNHPGIAALGRLRPGVDLEEARADLERVAIEIEQEYPDTNTGVRINSEMLHTMMTEDSRTPLLILLLAVGLLLLIACANVANILVVRATTRQHELAVRSTLGAGGGQLIRLMLSESLLLWLTGGALGIALAFGTTRILATTLAGEIPRIFTISVDFTVIAGTLLIALLTGLLFGLAPALKARRPALQEFLKEGTRSSAGRGRQRLQGGLVVIEMTLALVLLTGAGLMLRSFAQMTGAETGLEADNVLSMEIDLPGAKYPDEARRLAFYYDLLDRVRALPGVVSAATTYVLPLGRDNWQNSFHVEGHPPPENEGGIFAEMSAVSADYFRTMGIALLAGREFTREDDGTGNRLTVIVDEQVAEHYWPGESPLGKRLAFGSFDDPDPDWLEVVGVVDHVKLNGVAEQSRWQIYIPHALDNDLGYYLVAKTAGDPLALVEPIRDQVLKLDPEQPISQVRTMEDYRRASTEESGFITLLLGLFAGAALLLAAVGIYGVMAFATTQRRHEIGIRMALGARSPNLLGMVIGQGLLKVAIGIGIGLPLAGALGIVYRSQLFGVAAIDPVTFIAAPVFLALVAIVAVWAPAWRTTRIDPVETLRQE